MKWNPDPSDEPQDPKFRVFTLKEVILNKGELVPKVGRDYQVLYKNKLVDCRMIHLAPYNECLDVKKSLTKDLDQSPS